MLTETSNTLTLRVSRSTNRKKPGGSGLLVFQVALASGLLSINLDGRLIERPGMFCDEISCGFHW